MSEAQDLRPGDTKMAKKDPKGGEAGDPQPEGTPENGASGGEHRGRLPWRKRELPGGLWLKCENCGATIYRKEVVDRGYTCPSCEFHFTMPGRDRVQRTLDGGSWEELFPDLEALDRLDFVDSAPYGEKIDKAVKRTGQREALIFGRGEIHGRPI
ncbi:MAG: hypothetical protein AAFR54_17460, partial [Planctomycetota bacterium]